MEKEISNGAMLGIVLIALAAIIGLGFGIFSIAKGTANEGVTGVQENLGAVGSSAFTDFDQKIVTGTQVVSAYHNFDGKPYAILIATQATKDKSGTSTTGHSFAEGAGMKNAYGDDLEKLPIVEAFKDADKNRMPNVLDSKGNEIDLKFINYNALLGSGKTVDENDNIIDLEAMVYFDSNCWRATEGFATQGGKVLMNGITGNLSKSGMMEYVPSGSRFQSYLIKDLSGTIMGIAFEQLNSK
jgi:hypothetical protein